MALINLVLINSAGRKERGRAVSIGANVDKSAIEDLLSDVGDTALQRLVGIFAEECEKNCREISRFLSKKDFAGSEIVAHRFKSTARQFGVAGLAEICQELERACATGHNDEARELFEALTLITPQVLANLNKAMASVLRSG